MTASSVLPAAGSPRVATSDLAPSVELTVSRIAARDLTDDHVRLWSQIQQTNELLQSPFFRPEFTQAVAAVRSDVEVAILNRGAEIVGFLPFQRRCQWLGRPVAAGLNDFQGVICDATCAVDPQQLLRGCGLLTWKFDHLIVAQPALETYSWLRRPSPYLDVADGFTAFLANRESASRRIRGTIRKAPKLEREHGPIRFMAQATDSGVFQFLRERKSTQCRRTGAPDVFAFPWAVQLLERLNREPSRDCCGLLSALYAGERLIAVQQGLRSGSVLHCWITTYRAEPGQVFARLDAVRATRPRSQVAGDSSHRTGSRSGAVQGKPGVGGDHAGLRFDNAVTPVARSAAQRVPGQAVGEDVVVANAGPGRGELDPPATWLACAAVRRTCN